MIRRPPRSPLFPSTTLFLSDPPPVVGVFGRDPLQVLGALGQLLLEVSAVRRRRLLGHRRLLLAHLFLSGLCAGRGAGRDRKSTRLNSSHANISYAVFCLTKA